MPKCAYCQRRISRIYRSVVKLDAGKWFCNFRHWNLHRAGYNYEPLYMNKYIISIGGILAMLAFYTVVIHR